MITFDTVGFTILSIIFIVFVLGIIFVFSFLKGKWQITYLVKVRMLSIYIVAIILISLLYIAFVLPKMEAKHVDSYYHQTDIYNMLREKQAPEVLDEYRQGKWDIVLSDETLIIDTVANEWGYLTD